MAIGDIGRRVVWSGEGGVCCTGPSVDDRRTGGGDCDGGGGRVECAEGVGGGDWDRGAGGGDCDRGAGAGDWDIRICGGGDGVAVRSTAGVAVRFLLLCLRACLCDFFDATPRLEVDACGGVASILAFFRGGAGSESSLASWETTFGFPRNLTGGSSTTGLSLLDLTVDLASSRDDSAGLGVFLALVVVAAFLFVPSTSLSFGVCFTFPPLEYLQRLLRREHTWHAIIAPFASTPTSHDSNSRLMHASHCVVYVR